MYRVLADDWSVTRHRLIVLVYGRKLFYSLKILQLSGGMARISPTRMRLWLIADYRFFTPLPAC